MDLHFTEEHELLRRTIRDFARDQILPHVREWDEKGVFPSEVIPQLAELGLLGVIFPENLGGSGLSYIDYVLIVEELSRVDPSIGITVAAHNSLCANHIYMAGNPEQHERFLPRLTGGQTLGAWGLTEPQSGSDAGNLRTTARKVDGGWIINGAKTFITNASVAEIAVIIARPENPPKRSYTHGFVLEKGMKGFSVGKKENKLGLRASDTAELIFEDCFVPQKNFLGKPGEGFKDALRVLDGGRISIAALSLGGAQGALDTALAYSKERESFGKKICEFQAIQWILADMATRIEAARLLTLQAAAAKDSGKTVTKLSAMAKYYASEVSVWAAERAVQVLGGYGFVKDFPAEKFYRDVKLNTIGEGTSEIQRMVIAREILKEGE